MVISVVVFVIEAMSADTDEKPRRDGVCELKNEMKNRLKDSSRDFDLL